MKLLIKLKKGEKFEMSKYDFSGWATRNDLLCGDGRTIRKNAFKNNDGQTVPLIYNHIHDNPDAVLGHAVLENRDEGVYAYGTFNDSESGQAAKRLVQHGDVRSLSIWANQLKQIGGDVIHGNIRELSLVLAGANPGAFIDFAMAHGDDEEDSLVASWDENIVLYHSADADNENNTKEDESEVAEETKKPEEEKSEGGKTIGEVLDTLNDEQKNAVYAIIDELLPDDEDDEDDNEDDEDNKGGNDMKHNVFENEVEQNNILSHSAQEEILKNAKSSQVGSFQAALQNYVEANSLQHSDGEATIAAASGFAQTGEPYNITTLFPEYKEVRPGAPELITDDQGWVSVVMNKVHKSPISRIRTTQVDIRNIEGQMDALRAQGYKKGTKKGIVGNYNLVRRTTDPQTVFVKSALHRDDIIDITDFDIVAYQYNIDRMNLNEELATAIMFGDGREPGAEGKIEADKIRPIWGDDPLYTMYVDIDFEAAKQELQGTGTGVSFGENYIKAEAMVNACLYAREKFKGTGTPDMFIEPHQLNVMLLARDMNGRRIYATKAELAAALNVGNIYTCEKMAGKTRADGGKTKKLHAIIVNLNDYSLGATKGGAVAHFTQFDIDFNQQKSLLETRVSGASTRVYSAIAIEEDVTDASDTPAEG